MLEIVVDMRHCLWCRRLRVDWDALMEYRSPELDPRPLDQVMRGETSQRQRCPDAEHAYGRIVRYTAGKILSRLRVAGRATGALVVFQVCLVHTTYDLESFSQPCGVS